MADSLTAANDLTRKRSRSSSPTADSAAKKANQAAAGPANLEVDDEDDGSAAAAAAAGPPTNGGGNDADAKPESTTAAAPMNVDSSGIPAKPVGAEVSSEDAQAQSHASQNITMRTLIVTQDASVIIGKQGKNINEIRDRSGSKLNITESVAGNPERIMSVSGPLDAVSKVRLARTQIYGFLLMPPCNLTGFRTHRPPDQRRAVRCSLGAWLARSDHPVGSHLRRGRSLCGAD